MEENRIYIIDHNYGETQITGLRNALNMYGVLWSHYHPMDRMSDFEKDQDQVKADLERNGYHEDCCGYLAIMQLTQD